jgi:excisionase family DNA binding protein
MGKEVHQMIKLNQSVVLPDSFIDQIAKKLVIRINEIVCLERHNNFPEYMSVKEVSSYLGMSERWVQDRVKNKSIPHVKFGGSLKFSLSDISKWVIEFKVPAVNKPPNTYLNSMK